MAPDARNQSSKDSNAGAAVFLYTDSATGVSQKFAFNLRYYVDAHEDKKFEKKSKYASALFEKRRLSGLYDLKVNKTKKA